MDKMLSKYQKMPVTVRATFWFLICSFLQRGISFITTPIFTRLLSTAEYGEFNVFQSWLTILTVIVTLNLPWGVYPQGLVKFEESKDKFASSLQGLLLVLVCIWSLVYFVFHDAINSLLGMTTAKMVAMLIMMWTSSVFCFWSAYERTDFRYKDLVILTLLVSVLKPVLGIILVISQNDKVIARIWGLVVVELVCYAWLFVRQMRKGKAFFDLSIWKYALAFNLTLVPHYLSQTILSGADRIMIERMVSSDKAGIYSLAYSLSLLMLVFNSSMEQAINPWIYKQIKEKRIGDIKTVVYPAIGIVAVLNVLLMVFAPGIVRIFAPASYYDAIWVIPPVSMSVFYMFLYDMFANFEFYYEKTKYMSIATVLGAAINIVLNYIFIKLFGYYAAGYTTFFCYLCYAVFHYIVMRYVCLKKEEQPYSLSFLIPVSLSFIGIGFAMLLTYNYAIVRYTIFAIILIFSIIKRKNIKNVMFRLANIRNSNIK